VFPLDLETQRANVKFKVVHPKINLFSVDPRKERTTDILVQFAFALWNSQCLEHIFLCSLLIGEDLRLRSHC
jgi:hypothetical protein